MLRGIGWGPMLDWNPQGRTMAFRGDSDSEQGLTIVELLTVLALTAVIASMAGSRLPGLMNTIRLDTVSHTLLRDLHFARSSARSTGDRHIVLISDEGYEIRREGRMIRKTRFPKGVALESVVATRVIWFASQGRSSGGYVRLRAGRALAQVVVPAASGLAYLASDDLP